MAYRDAGQDAQTAAAKTLLVRRNELQAELASARAERDRLGEEMAVLALSLRDEQEDVARLKSGPRAVLARLTGRYDVALERETSEADAARAAYDEKKAAFARSSVRIAELEQAIRALGDVDSLLAAALESKARTLRERGGAATAALTAIESSRDAIQAFDRELAAVLASGAAANERLLAMLHELSAPRTSQYSSFPSNESLRPDMPPMRHALARFRAALDAIRSRFGAPLPDVPPLVADQYVGFSSPSVAPKHFALVAASVTDALILLENRRTALRDQQAAVSAEWAALVERA